MSAGPERERIAALVRRYDSRSSLVYRTLRPPVPVVHNRRPDGPPLPRDGGPCLLVGGAGGPSRPGFINVDMTPFPGVHVVADVQRLPFRSGSVVAIDCDAVLEHVRDAVAAVDEMFRVLEPGGRIHVVVPFNHPFHAYPDDYHRWTVHGLAELLKRFDDTTIGISTGPTATLLTYFLEYVKVVAPKPLKRPMYALAGWIVWPLRYLDVVLNRRADAHVLANTLYAFATKPGVGREKSAGAADRGSVSPLRR